MPEKIFESQIPAKAHVYWICNKELLTLNYKKRKSNKKWTKVLKRNYKEEYVPITNKYMKRYSI